MAIYPGRTWIRWVEIRSIYGSHVKTNPFFKGRSPLFTAIQSCWYFIELDTLWLCQQLLVCYWQLRHLYLIFPFKKTVFFHSYVNVYQAGYFSLNKPYGLFQLGSLALDSWHIYWFMACQWPSPPGRIFGVGKSSQTCDLHQGMQGSKDCMDWSKIVFMVFECSWSACCHWK